MLSLHLRASIRKLNLLSKIIKGGASPIPRNLHKTAVFLQIQASSNVIPCNTVNIEEQHFRYNIGANSIFQFYDVPSNNEYQIPPQNGSQIDANWLNDASVSNKELIERLIFVSNYCQENHQELTSTEFDTFVDNFTARLADFTENELVAALQIFSRIPHKHMTLNDRNFAELWMAFDDNCGLWSQRYTVDKLVAKLLVFCDVWSEIHMRRRSKFAQIACRKLYKRSKLMGAQQYVQAILFTRQIGKYNEDKTLFIKDLDRLLDDISVNELGILCGSLSKEKSYQLSKPDLVHRILAKVEEEKNFDTVDGRSLIQILCVIRDSIRLEHKDALANLMRTLAAQIPIRSPKIAEHISTLGERINLFDDACIEALTTKAIENVAEFTLVDMQQTVYTLAKAQPDSKVALTALTNILREIPKRIEEIADAPRQFISLVHGLSIFGLYNEELIHNALRKDFLDAIYPHSSMYRSEVFALDAFARINLHGKYTGSQLEGKNQKAVIKTVMSYIPDKHGKFKIHGTDSMLIQIEDIARDLYKYLNYGHALPHMAYSDIYLIYDKDKREFIDYSHEFPEPYLGTVMWKHDLLKGKSNLEAVALVGSYYKNHCCDSNIRNALHQIKFDQLEILGYKAIDVCFTEWIKLTDQQRRVYIEDKINKILADL